MTALHQYIWLTKAETIGQRYVVAGFSARSGHARCSISTCQTRAEARDYISW